jgi:sialate O-acetylesterase
MNKAMLYLLLVYSIATTAQTKLASFFGDNMVLQQEQEVSIWGTDTPKTEITINTGWGKEVSTKTDKNGKWRVKITTPKADNKSYTVKIKGSEEIVFNNVVLGEVWLCSGQSNMEMPVRGFPNSPINGSNEAILNARNKNIRLFHTGRKASLTPVDDVKGKWTEATPKTVAYFSAVAYFFGKKLNDVLDVPIGLINSSWGGANAEAWTDAESMKQFDDIKIPTEIGKPIMHTPTVLYNGMIAPFIGYSIKGALWNQGESNRTRPEQYKKLLPAMIKGWRDKWGIGNFSFYMSQVPPFHYGTGEYATFIVESQVYIMQNIENTGLAPTTDIGKCKDIHAPEKILISNRLAYWALAKDYGFESISYKGPVYESMEVFDKNRVRIHFEKSDRDRGLTNNGNKYDVKGFEIAGADKKFYPANAAIGRNNSVVVWNEDIANPVAVRYAFGNCIIGTLFNTQGIPATAFRTDNWDNIGRKNEEQPKK